MSSSKSKEIADEYISSLSDLTINSKPLINMLTMLAEDNVEHAPAIVQAVETHLQKVRSDIKLPVLYLIDSIVKNVNGAYTNLFTQNIVNIFCGVFEKVDESTRASMWKLRQTWNEVFPAKKLFSLDVRVHSIDPAWPITASPTSISSISSGSIHLNPRFLSLPQTTPAIVPPVVPAVKLPSGDPVTIGEAAMREQLLKKQRELLELQKKKIELELLQATASLEQQQRQLTKQAESIRAETTVPTLHVAPTMETKPVSPSLPSQTSKHVTKQFPAATASLLKNSGVTNGPRIAPASSIAVASARPVSRDPRLKPSASSGTESTTTSNTDPRLRVSTGTTTTSDNQSLANQQVTNTVLSEQLKQQITSKQAVTSTSMNKPSSNIASSDNSMINSSNNNNGNTNLNNNNNNKNFSGNANKDAVSHRTSQKKDPRSSSNSSSSNNSLNGNNSKIVQGQSLVNNNNNNASSTSFGSSRGSGGSDSLKSKDKNFANRQSNDNKTTSSSASSKSSSYRKLGNKSRSKQPQGSPSKLPKVERENSPARSKSNEKDSEDSSTSVRTSPTQSSSSSQNLKNRKKNSSKSRKRSSSPSYRIPRRNDTKSNSSLSSSGGVTEEEQSGSLIVSPPHPPTFKEIRPNARQRNYVRRNRDGSLSPETTTTTTTTTVISAAIVQLPNSEPIVVDPSTKDEDLRSALPLLPTTTVCVGLPEKKEDLDLRVLAVGGNKRQSSEHLESSATKKTKAEKFDALFGNEDVDLRTLTHPSAGRPPTPPPPIISGEDGKDGWAKLKQPTPKGPREKQTANNSDEKRDRDRDRDRLGRPRLYNKLPDDPKERRRTLSSDDSDIRPGRRGREPDKPERNADRNIEIIMKQAAEQLNQGSITKVQYNTLIQEVLQMSEDQKLRAALRKEKEGTSIVWEKGGIDVDRTPTFSPSSDGEAGRGNKESQMSRNQNSGARWQGQQPWQSPGPWAHPAGPFPGPLNHFNPDYRPVGPWQNPRHYGPIRPEFNQFHGGFNQNMGPNQRLGPGIMGPMGPNGPMIPNLIPNGPMGPMGMPNPPMPPGIQMSNMNGPASLIMNNGAMPPPNVLSSPNVPAGANMSPNMPSRNLSPNLPPKYEQNESDNDFGGTLVKGQGQLNRELPPPDPKILDEVTKDTMKSINIDGVPREIRYYGDTGVVFLNWDNPREIGFQDGMRRILIDEKDTVTCSFNGVYKEFMYEGEVHRVKIGAPTRELWVDDRWYECYFGGPPINIFLSGKKVAVKLEGPPPQVKIGNVKRTDLVIAKINLIINARNMVPVFLDAKPQIFEIEGKPNTLEFTDALQTVLLNGRPFKVEFGGLPKPIFIRDKKHFIRFSVLPRGFRAGYVKIFGMRGESPIESPPTPPILDNKANPDPQPVQQAYPSTENDSASQDASDLNSTPKPDLQLDILSSVLPSAMAPSSGLSYQAEQQAENTTAAPSLPLNLNMDELFQRLVATGIVPNLTTEQKKQKEEEEEKKKEPEIIPVSFDKPETLKVKQPAISAALYSGMQCSSCGARFAPELATRYSHHLDWHFRQNRRERDSARKAHSRPWYYDVSDWIQYEEIEDLEDRAQSWFETEKQTAETEGTTAEDLPQETVQPSVATISNEDTQCQVCHDAFEQFYNEEKEEWHIRPAINFEGKNYHPLCLEDHKRSMDDSNTAMEETVIETEEEKKEDEEMENTETETEVKTDVDTEAKPEVEGSVDKPEGVEESIEKSINEEGEENKTAIVSEEMKDDDIENIKVDDKNKEEDKDIEEIDENDITDRIQGVDFADVKIKEEPIDEEEIEDDGAEEEQFVFDNVEVKTEPIDPEPEETVVNEPAMVDTTYTAVKSSIDGNVELESASAAQQTAPSRIKINITKPLTATKESEEPKDKINTESTIPDNVTAEVLRPASIKQSLQGKKLSNLPPVEKGHELSGLCSIM